MLCLNKSYIYIYVSVQWCLVSFDRLTGRESSLLFYVRCEPVICLATVVALSKPYYVDVDMIIVWFFNLFSNWVNDYQSVQTLKEYSKQRQQWRQVQNKTRFFFNLDIDIAQIMLNMHRKHYSVDIALAVEY